MTLQNNQNRKMPNDNLTINVARPVDTWHLRVSGIQNTRRNTIGNTIWIRVIDMNRNRNNENTIDDKAALNVVALNKRGCTA